MLIAPGASPSRPPRSPAPTQAPPPEEFVRTVLSDAQAYMQVTTEVRADRRRNLRPVMVARLSGSEVTLGVEDMSVIERRMDYPPFDHGRAAYFASRIGKFYGRGTGIIMLPWMTREEAKEVADLLEPFTLGLALTPTMSQQETRALLHEMNLRVIYAMRPFGEHHMVRSRRGEPVVPPGWEDRKVRAVPSIMTTAFRAGLEMWLEDQRINLPMEKVPIGYFV